MKTSKFKIPCIMVLFSLFAILMFSCSNDIGMYVTVNPDDGVDQPEVKIGEYNVIAQYNNSDHKEYVSWETGSVNYLVYDNTGALMPAGTQVKLPRGTNPDKIYTTSANGAFEVAKSDLPTSGNNTSYGISQILVGGKWINSYQNTYVPDKVKVRLRILAPSFDSVAANIHVNQLDIPFAVERQLDPSKQWEIIPSYVGTTLINVKLYTVSENGDTIYTNSSSQLEISASTSSIYKMDRKVIDSQFVKVSIYNPTASWSGNATDKVYKTLLIDNHCYGDTIMGDGVVQDVPMQPAPLYNKLVVTEYAGGEYFNVVYSYDTTAVLNEINKDLMFEQNYTEESTALITGFDKKYVPTKITMTDQEILDNKYIDCRFDYYNGTTHIGVANIELASLASQTIIEGARFGSIAYTGCGIGSNFVWDFFSYQIGTINKLSTGNYEMIPMNSGMDVDNISITN